MAFLKEPSDRAIRSERLYHERFKQLLEPTYKGKFLAIEPDSEEYFLGDSMHDAVTAMRTAHPEKLCHVMRVGYRAAVYWGYHDE